MRVEWEKYRTLSIEIRLFCLGAVLPHRIVTRMNVNEIGSNVFLAAPAATVSEMGSKWIGAMTLAMKMVMSHNIGQSATWTNQLLVTPIDGK